jgi:hypothetical protein
MPQGETDTMKTIHNFCTRSFTSLVAGALSLAACDVAEPSTATRSVEFESVVYEDDAGVIEATTPAEEISIASLRVIPGVSSRVEMEFQGDAFVVEYFDAGEVRVQGEFDDATVAWSSNDGEMPAVLAERWAPLVEAWNTALVDEQGQLRREYVSAIEYQDGGLTPDEIHYSAWGFGCAVGMVFVCAAFTGPAAIGCGLAGAVYCSEL